MSPLNWIRPERGLLALTALLLLSVAVGWAAERSHEATGPGVVRLTDVQSSLAIKGAGGIGTIVIAMLRLFGSGTRSRPIGQGVLTCMHVSKKIRSCSGSYVLPRGMI